MATPPAQLYEPSPKVKALAELQVKYAHDQGFTPIEATQAFCLAVLSIATMVEAQGRMAKSG